MPPPPHCTPHCTPPPSPPVQYEAGDASLQRVADDCLAREGVLVPLARYSKLERARPPPSLRCVGVGGRVGGEQGGVLLACVWEGGGKRCTHTPRGAAAMPTHPPQFPPLPSPRVALSAAHTPKEVERAVAALRASLKRVLG